MMLDVSAPGLSRRCETCARVRLRLRLRLRLRVRVSAARPEPGERCEAHGPGFGFGLALRDLRTQLGHEARVLARVAQALGQVVQRGARVGPIDHYVEELVDAQRGEALHQGEAEARVPVLQRGGVGRALGRLGLEDLVRVRVRV